MKTFPIDGNTSLADQQNTLRFIELAGPAKLLTYTKKKNLAGSGAKVNAATFENIGLDDEIPKLFLMEVGGGQNAVAVISGQLAQGKTVVFHERVFVAGIEREIIGFR
jgi:hypothetical protein